MFQKNEKNAIIQATANVKMGNFGLMVMTVSTNNHRHQF